MENVLFVTSEMYPLVKTGGLADVSHSLPDALLNHVSNVAVALPGYPAVVDGLEEVTAKHSLYGFGIPEGTQLWLGKLKNSALTLWVIVNQSLYDRSGGPYVDADKGDWDDNALRFATFCRSVVQAIIDPAVCEKLGWLPTVVHCNDWPTGLVPALLSLQPSRPTTVFTIHNLAYQGLFDESTFNQLQLPIDWWALNKLEFYGNFSFLKAGIVFADSVTTVSPTYAREILTPEYGCGLEGLLTFHQEKLFGILNGVDYSIWSPEHDEHLWYRFSSTTLHLKLQNKLRLQESNGLDIGKDILLIGVVSRLVHQKGVELVITAISELIDESIQWVILGAGDEKIENAFLSLARSHPKKVSVTLGYDEDHAHRIEASADAFAMPSRYEPCGLNQMYSLRYATLPIVRATGGLADTVSDLNTQMLAGKEQTVEAQTLSDKANEKGTGFVFVDNSTDQFIEAVMRAVKLFKNDIAWREAQRRAMSKNYSWDVSAKEYVRIYKRLK